MDWASRNHGWFGLDGKASEPSRCSTAQGTAKATPDHAPGATHTHLLNLPGLGTPALPGAAVPGLHSPFQEGVSPISTLNLPSASGNRTQPHLAASCWGPP